MTTTAALDEDKVAEFLMQMITDGGAALSGMSVAIGDRLGLYTAMAGSGPTTSAELAARTGLVERYLREWLAVQVAGGYLEYDEAADTYLLTPERAAVLADPMRPTYFAGFFTLLSAVYATEDKLVDAFRTGAGVGWDEHPDALFSGTAKFFRPGYASSIVGEWLPAMDGVLSKLTRGARVADIGCGYGYSTVIMADAFPESSFVGFDYHPASIEAATRVAQDAGLSGRVRFEVASAADFPGNDYDLITCFDCLHDMGDPGAVARRVLAALAPDGNWMIVEPNCSERLSEDVNPMGRVFTAASLSICLPSAIAQHGPQALGNHAGEEALKKIVTESGFRRWRRAMETPVNRVYEARP